MIVKIRRGKDIQSYTVDNIDKRTTILEVLDYIKFNNDPTLSYRVQCRASICGTCAVKVNGNTALACKTKALDIANNDEILIEPVGNLPIIKDLVVDHGEFLDKLKQAKSWFVPKEPLEKVFPEEISTYDRETDCILCGICYSVCPVFQNDKNFGGPINFVKIFRFWKDKNDALGDERIEIAKLNNITSCIHCKYCTLSCPKQIPVEADILQLEFYGKQKGIIQQNQQINNLFGFGF
ncbi:MAG: 2Fe-2S iron-sulfur cluster-binding protein [Hydrogenothermaceae bacterium]